MKHNDNNKQEEIDKILLSMTTPHAAPIIKSFYEFQEKHKAIVLNKYSNPVKYMEDVTDFMIRIIYELNFLDKSQWPHHRTYQYLFFPGALLSLWRSFQTAIEGFYGESVMIIRSVFESYLRMVFISFYPQSWESAVSKIKLKNRPNFSVSNFIEHKLKVDWVWIYEFQSYYSHAKQFEVIKTLKQTISGVLQEPIVCRLAFDEKQFRMCLNFCCISTYALLTLIREFFPEVHDHPNLIPRGKQRFQATLKFSHLIVEGIKGELSKAAADIDKISKMVRAAERGEDWESLA